MDCGGTGEVFHHLDPSTKLFTIGVNRGRAVTLAEIEKCVVLCRPCHARRHAYGRV